MSEKSSRYETGADHNHTGPDCATCAKLQAELSPEDKENAALVDSLMEQWDGMITRGGNYLLERLRRAGTSRLKAFKEKYIEFPKVPPK